MKAVLVIATVAAIYFGASSPVSGAEREHRTTVRLRPFCQADEDRWIWSVSVNKPATVELSWRRDFSLLADSFDVPASGPGIGHGITHWSTDVIEGPRLYARIAGHPGTRVLARIPTPRDCTGDDDGD